jgi:hypothetical protein
MPLKARRLEQNRHLRVSWIAAGGEHIEIHIHGAAAAARV